MEEVKKIIENAFKITLDNNNFSTRKLYSRQLFFFERELKQDHYFVLNQDPDFIYKVEHNPDNYNPEKTKRGKFEDYYIIYIDKAEKLNINDLKRKEVKDEVTDKALIIKSIQNRLEEINSLITLLK
jgi:hypothetical protein